MVKKLDKYQLQRIYKPVIHMHSRCIRYPVSSVHLQFYLYKFTNQYFQYYSQCSSRMADIIFQILEAIWKVLSSYRSMPYLSDYFLCSIFQKQFHSVNCQGQILEIYFSYFLVNAKEKDVSSIVQCGTGADIQTVTLFSVLKT